MANLYARLWRYKKDGSQKGLEQTATADAAMVARLETWEGSVEVELDKDGDYEVRIGPKDAPRKIVGEGNVNDRTSKTVAEQGEPK